LVLFTKISPNLQIQERSRPIRDVQGTSQYLNTDSTDTETQSSSFVNLNGSERLPGAVLLARDRLFERLRGVSLSSNRSVLNPLINFTALLDLHSSLILDFFKNNCFCLIKILWSMFWFCSCFLWGLVKT